MSEAYERERQNNSRLDELSSKISALRGVTVDIYDNARNQDVIDNSVQIPSLLLYPLATYPAAPYNPISQPICIYQITSLKADVEDNIRTKSSPP
ncbi:MAG: hypothetical protein Q9188_004434 [Gyalolechia gomerana]